MPETRSLRFSACLAVARRAAAAPALLLMAGVAMASPTSPPQPADAAVKTLPAKPAAKSAATQPATTKPATTKPATAGAPVAKPAAGSAARAGEPAKPAAKSPAGSAAKAPVTTASIGRPSQATARAADASDQGSFSAFVGALWPEAQQRGVTRATFQSAFTGVTPDPKIIELTRKQSEFVKPIWEYVNGAVTPTRIEQGGEAAKRWSPAIAAAESRYGVERSVILGIWGMETNFGSFTGGKDVIRSLATLAHEQYRGDFFKDELLTALVILQQGHVDREDMKGSWAGAMGQTQFMPSSFMKFAVDADGDGHKNIWTSIPDAMASTANYLRQHGWTPGLPWGFEVQLPDGFDWRMQSGSFGAWRKVGLKRADGDAMPRSGEATLFLPAGARGPAFLITSNFAVIKRYNSSDAYAIGVGHLGDRVMGGDAIAARWPVGERQLDRVQRLEVQRQLNRLGFDVGEPDGKLGSKTREAVRNFQQTRGLVPDGYPTVALLEALRGVR
ncbi:MAG: lytic murein transglycosylase [Burkholderiales bacterium]|nr:lytic murein transglycosylase [Burkholderiales bacterium]